MARCQVCDGPVVNSRCKWCGMPYRNDEIMYHLNESRSEHYQHATSKARALIRENQTPLPDRRQEQAKAAAYGGEKKKTAETADARMKKRLTEEKGTAKEILEQRVRVRRQAAELEKMQKQNKKRSWFAIFLVVFLLAVTVIPQAIEFVKEKYEMEWASAEQAEWTAPEEASSEPVVSEQAEPEDSAAEQAVSGQVTGGIDTDELLLMGILDTEVPGIAVADKHSKEEIKAGMYVAEVPTGFAEIVVQYAESGKPDETYLLEGENNQAVLELHKGDSVYMSDYDGEYNYVTLYIIEQSDELAGM